jgi:alcohol dehydrogenase class IV
MQPLVFTTHPTCVVFGAGSLQHVLREIELLGARRALVLSAPGQRAGAEQVVAYNAQAAPHAMQRIARAIGAVDAAQGMYDLAIRLHAPISPRQIGMPQNELERCCIEVVLRNAYADPQPIEKAGLRGLLEDAYHGRRPERTLP